MKVCLGDYAKIDVPLSLITQKRVGVGDTSPEIAALKGIRYAVMQEASKGDTINDGIMKQLTGGDVFLNRMIGDEDGNDLMSLLPDDSPNPEELAENNVDNKHKKNWLEIAINTLSDREQTIIKSRKLKNKSLTLEELGIKLKISKERVRQIETKALEKLKIAIVDISQQNKEFFV